MISTMNLSNRIPFLCRTKNEKNYIFVYEQLIGKVFDFFRPVILW